MMPSIPTTVLGVGLLLIILYLVTVGSSRETGKEPPGPKPLPLLGNLLQLDLQRPYKTLCELSKKYGSVFTVYFGPKKVVVLTGYRTVREALVGYADEFGEREIAPIFADVTKHILFSNGETWREMRRFALSTLKDFGMGKRVAEEKILEECGHLIKVFESYKGKPFNTSCPTNNAASNIISSIVFGSRFEYDDPRFRDLVSRVVENIKIGGSAGIQLYNTFPRLVGWIKSRQVMLKNGEKTIRDVKKLMQKLKETLNPQTCRGLVDCFLVRKQKEEDSCVKDTQFTEKNLLYTVANLFAAGTDTTSASLRWSLLLMAKYPHIQDQVQEELTRVVGNREVHVEDRKNLPYTDAVVHEIQRFCYIVPMAIPHKTSRDVTFQGFFIKEVSKLMMILLIFLSSGNYCDSPPWKIYQERCLSTIFCRVRLREGLARMSLFLFFTSLLQRFRFMPPPGVSKDDLDLTPAVGFTIPPSPHELCALSRQ
uniref:Cytochrome P450 2K1-like n=1 Tax=Poecilia latipinna TaxID=48699 RepID=A0A3B3U105_9TELE